MMKSITLGVVIVLAAFVFCQDSRGDELKLKDGSTVVGKLIKEIPGKSYRMLISDGSEIVYSADKVESIAISDNAISNSKPDQTEGSAVTQAPVAAPVIYPATGRFSGDTKRKGHAKPATFGVGIGKYGIVGAELHLRPSDRFGFSGGIGVWAYEVEIQEYGYTYYYDYTYERTEKGAAAGLGIKEHLYFTNRDKPSQHSIFLYQGFSDGYGPAIGLGYSFEHYFRSGMGFNAGIGLIAAPSVDEYLAKKIGVPEEVVDVTWIPILFEIGFTF